MKQLTVADLKEYLENYPDDSLVFVGDNTGSNDFHCMKIIGSFGLDNHGDVTLICHGLANMIENSHKLLNN